MFCTGLFTCLTFLSELSHPAPFSALGVGEFDQEENTWSLPPGACDLQQRGAAPRPHLLSQGQLC